MVLVWPQEQKKMLDSLKLKIECKKKKNSKGSKLKTPDNGGSIKKDSLEMN